jgi:hypothetical protein
MDLLDWFRGRRPWPQLLRLIEQLPRHSHYKAALVNDPDMAARIVEQRAKSPTKARPPVTDWSPEVDMLAHVADAVRSLVSLTIKVNSKGGNGPDAKPVTRPRTAVDRADRAAFERRMNVLIKKVVPNQPGGET